MTVSPDGMSLTEVFDNDKRRESTRYRDLELFTRACAMHGNFVIADVGQYASYFPAARMLRLLFHEGELLRVNPMRRSPVVYRWADEC